jgi:polar amino acid transport system substrate-binding protein
MYHDADTVQMKQPSPEVLRDLAPSGTLRVAVNYGNPVLARKDPATGQPTGISVDLARELGRWLGVPLSFVTFDAAGKVFAAAKENAWDVAFLARDPSRAIEILFTAPYVIIEGTYLVPESSPFQKVEDLDRPGVRIAVGKGAAYDLYLSRALKHAELVRADTSAGAVDLFLAQKLDAAAGVKNPLVEFARTHAGVRVIPGRFTAIEQAMGTPRKNAAGGRYLHAFVEELKRCGFVGNAIERSGQRDATVAPAEPPGAGQ